MRTRIRAAIGTTHALHTVQSWEGLRASARETHADVLVVDPVLDVSVGQQEIAALFERFPSSLVIFYTYLTQDACRVISANSRRLHRVIFFGLDDSMMRTQLAFTHLAERLLILRVLINLRDKLDRLPTWICAYVERTIACPEPLDLLLDMAHSRGMLHADVCQVFLQAGLSFPERFVAAGELIRAYSRSMPCERDCRWTSLGTGACHDERCTRLVEVFGLSPDALRSCTDTRYLSQRLCCWLQQPL
jgi:hypothetical protein